MSKTMANQPRKRVRIDGDEGKLKRKEKETDDFLSEEGGSGSDDDDQSVSAASASDDNDEEEIMRANEAAHKKKPRRRAVNESRFGQSITGLLEAPPTKAKLRAAKGEKHPKLEERARRIAAQTRHEQLECAHVKDVIGGWGARPGRAFSEWSDGEDAVDELMENAGGAVKEKELRRTAQRGVVKLFNAIRAAQGAPANGPSAATATIPNATANATSKGKNTVQTASTKTGEESGANILGARGKNAALSNMSRDAFLLLIEKGCR